MKAAIYIRVSTDEQAKEGFSIEAQKRKLISYADSQDWEVSDFYIDDGYSAKDLKRPAMKRMLADMLKSRFDIVLVHKLDRLTRSASDCDLLLKSFDANKVKFQSSTESFETRTATGRLFIRIIADMAQWERENIAERVRFGMEQKAMEGKKPGGRYPYGYDSTGNPVPEEVEAIRLLRFLYMVPDPLTKKTLSFKKIAVFLNQQGKQRRGFEWTQSTVGLTLENPFYAGIIRFGSKLPNGKYPARKREERVEVIESVGSHEAIWTKDEFDEHIKFMRRRSDAGYSRKVEYWFTGLLRCGKCGSAMYGRLTTKRSRKNGEIIRTPYYWCSKRKDNDSCNMPMFRQNHVEYLLFERIAGMKLEKKEYLQAGGKLKQAHATQDKEIAKSKRELESIKQRAKKWQYMFVEDLITAEVMRERMSEENQKESELIQRIDELMLERKQSNEGPAQLFELSETWSLISDLEKREFLHNIFKKITLHTTLYNVKGVKNKFFESSIVLEF